MDYIQETLGSNECIKFQTKYHYINFLGQIILTTCLGIIIFWLPVMWLKYTRNIFVVTNKRIIISSGIFSRHTQDLNISKLESIFVSQSFLGLLLGYGTIMFIGTGGTREIYKNIANPIELKQTVSQLMQ
jgi:uncharacterized membrane protein YdbT with pleckstrin-like domain